MFSTLQQSHARFARSSRRINTILAVLGVWVLLGLVLEYGFHLPTGWVRVLETLDLLILLLFVAAQIGKVLRSPDRREYILEHRLEYALTIPLLAVLVLVPVAVWIFPDTVAELARQWHLRGLSSLLILLAQIVIVLSLFFGALRVSRRLTRMHIQPARLFIASFVLVIVLGALALLLPRATTQGITGIDALFTSASAVCVTGLITVDTPTAFTRLGQVIILLLIQIGGLGLMTFTTFFALFSGRLSIKERVLMQDLLSRENLGEIRRTLLQIVGVTLLIEAAGAVLLFVSWDDALFPSTGQRIFSSVFHSVSAFCNAGFSLFGDNLAGRAVAMNVQVNITIAGLIVLGGLGFITIVNLAGARPWARGSHRLHHRLTAQSRIVLASTGILIVAAATLFFALEYHNTLAGLRWWEKIMAAVFQSITTRTAGFNTIDTGAIAVPSTLLFLFLMFIGASPGSTGGGIKTTTAALLLLAGIHYIRGKKDIEIGHRTIPWSTVDRASAVLFFSLVILALSVFLVSMFEPFALIDILFECVSAMGTVGLSRGITFALADTSKIILIFTMLIGRVGALTLMMALTRRAPLSRVDYPTEQIMVG
ncbi:MAG: potassium transporter TrkG [Bacteroidota bacterium]|jgi:potassium uptake TrkH family protein|nr:potassium transporter TrkG [Bacteroidota bacterium]